MYYRANNELIVSSSRDDEGNSVSRYIDKRHKKNQYGKLNYLIGGEIRKNDLHTRYKDRHSHTVNEVFNYCPVILNYIALRGYKKVLFVGHFEASQRSWVVPRNESLFQTPTFRASEDTMVDPNIWVQFLPIVRMAYGYDFEMHTVVPPESRHRQLMHSLYKRYNLDLVPSSIQYKHVHDIDIQIPDNVKYDCVVFAGVPKSHDSREFRIDDVKREFANYCESNFDVIDINNQDPDELKFVSGATYPNSQWLHECFALRGVWDETFRTLTPQDRQLEYGLIDNMINAYRA